MENMLITSFHYDFLSSELNTSGSIFMASWENGGVVHCTEEEYEKIKSGCPDQRSAACKTAVVRCTCFQENRYRPDRCGDPYVR